MLEGWKVGWQDGWNGRRLEVGRLEGWKVGKLEGSKVRRLEGWKVGMLEGWKVRRLKGWKAGRFKWFCHFPCFQTLPPSRASQARGEACVTVGPPTNRQCNLQSIVYRLQSCLGTAKKPSLVHFCLCGKLTCCNFLITDRSNLLFDITQQFGVHSVWAHNLIMYTKHTTYDTSLTLSIISICAVHNEYYVKIN